MKNFTGTVIGNMKKPTVEQARSGLAAARHNMQQAADEVIKAKNALAVANNHLASCTRLVKQYEADVAAASDRAEKNREAVARRKAKKLMDQYDIEIDKETQHGHTTIWISQPEWLAGDDPIEDGHFAHNWQDALTIIEFYAKHHPKHPDHENRQFNWHAPHI